MKKKMTKCRIG
jgi:hypothetical protein